MVYEHGALEEVLNELDSLREHIARKSFVIRRPDRPARKPRRPSPPVPGSLATIPLTISIGVARAPEAGRTPGEVLEAADQALYRAKATGRNRVCLAGRTETREPDGAS